MSLITIGLPVYNGEKYLDKALASLTAQSFDDFEILVADNASTDKTRDIIAKYQTLSHKITYHRQPNNIGMIGNFEWLFHNAKSKYFMLAAYDDLWSKDYVKNLYETMRLHKSLLTVPRVIKINPDDSEALNTPYNEKIDAKKGIKRIKLLLRWVQSGWFYGLFDKEELIKAYAKTNNFGHTWGNEFITMLPFLLSGKVSGNNKAIYYQRQTGLSEDNYKPKNFDAQIKLYKAFLKEAFIALKECPYNYLQKFALSFALLKYTDRHSVKLRRLVKSFILRRTNM